MSGLLHDWRIVTVASLGLLSACGQPDDAMPARQDAAPAQTASQQVLVYTALPSSQVQPVLDAYAAETGRTVELVVAEGDLGDGPVHSPDALPKADLYLGRSLTELWGIAEMDGFRPTDSPAIDSNIPPALRDQERRWTALSMRSSLIVYNTDVVSAAELETVQNYADLGGPAWRDRLCLSSSVVPGNRTLVASLIASHGLREAEIIVRNWRANLAGSVYPADDGLIKAVASGECGAGIVQSDALQTYVSRNAAAPVATHFFASSESIAVDVSGAGVMRHADNPDGAAELLSWLTTESANALFASLGAQFPANNDSPVSLSLEPLGVTVAAPRSMTNLGFLQEDAALLIERARYP